MVVESECKSWLRNQGVGYFWPESEFVKICNFSRSTYCINYLRCAAMAVLPFYGKFFSEYSKS